MGRLDSISGIPGNMNQLDMNADNIRNIIDELNRNSDQLDTLATGLPIIGRGSIPMTYDGTAGFAATVSANHGFATAPLFIVTFTRSDMTDGSGNLLSFDTPMYFFNNTTGDFEQRAYCYTNGTNIQFQFLSVVVGTPMTLNFSWYIIQQPAQVPTGL